MQLITDDAGAPPTAEGPSVLQCAPAGIGHTQGAAARQGPGAPPAFGRRRLPDHRRPQPRALAGAHRVAVRGGSGTLRRRLAASAGRIDETRWPLPGLRAVFQGYLPHAQTSAHRTCGP